MNNTTNDLKQLLDGGNFTWGKIIKWYNIDSYTICLYWDKYEHEHRYHIWIDEKNTYRSEKTLEHALATSMAIKHDGINSKAGLYFCRAIGIKD